MRVAWLLVISCLLASGVCADEIEFRAGVEYGRAGSNPLLLNLALPKSADNKPRPAIVVIHGGGWSGGKRGDHDPQIKDYAARGYVAATIDYRLAPKHVFPSQTEDCQQAVRWLREQREELQIDPDRIGAVGFSAGAHLAMLLGVVDADERQDPGVASSKVQAVVAFAGPTDLAADLPARSIEIVERFIGGKRDKLPDVVRRASPVTHISRDDAPLLLFQGSADEIVPCSQAYAMIDAMTKQGLPGRAEILVGAGHGWGSPEVERTFEAAQRFLDQHLLSGKSATASPAAR